MSDTPRWRTVTSKPHLGLMALIGVIVPRRLRVDWREEWESELRYRERLLSDWDRLDWRHKWDLPVYGVKVLDEHVTATLTPQRLLAHLISGFGMLALVLAGIGLYGLLAHTVSERTSEIGLRMALGADRRDVVRLFVTRGMKLALSGVAIGMAVASALTHLIQSLLFGVSPLDPLTLTMVPCGVDPGRAHDVLRAGATCGHGRSQGCAPLRLTVRLV